MSKENLLPSKMTNVNMYPADHWTLLQRFAEGDERDPKDCFNLADDVWDARSYASNVYPPHAEKYICRFTNLRSWIKLYVKLFSFERLMGRKGAHSSRDAKIAYHLRRADGFIIDHAIPTLDDLAAPPLFEALWEAQLIPDGSGDKARLTVDVVRVQKRTHAFWSYLSSVFGSPLYVPAIAPHTERPLSDVGADTSKLIPDAVVRQLVNILALHRDDIAPLSRYDHLRLCILLLQVCVGRRIEEVFAAPRGEGADGPLKCYPCRATNNDALSEALWFRFTPNKNGLYEWVYISSEWESLATYCVQQLVSYSDEVRHLASYEESNLLILVSRFNLTASPSVNMRVPLQPADALEQAKALACEKRSAGGLRFGAFDQWLNGYNAAKHRRVKRYLGFLEKWNVTHDGSIESQPYHMKTSHARHTRQSILAGDPRVTLLSRHQDLNHTGIDDQFTYQHVLDEENQSLKTKLMNSTLLGRSMQSLDELLGVTPKEKFGRDQPVLVTILTPRLQALIENNPHYFERNDVRLGICGESGGREDCELYDSRPGRIKGNGKRNDKKLASVTNDEANPKDPGLGKLTSQNALAAPLSGARGSNKDTNNAKAVVKKLKGRVQEIQKGEL